MKHLSMTTLGHELSKLVAMLDRGGLTVDWPCYPEFVVIIKETK